jgi:hypothetical protein
MANMKTFRNTDFLFSSSTLLENFNVERKKKILNDNFYKKMIKSLLKEERISQ